MKKWIFPALLLAFIIAVNLVVSPHLPDQMAIHWNAAGEPDRYASKGFALYLMPVVLAGVFLLMTFIQFIDPRGGNISKFQGEINRITYSLLAVLTLIHGAMIMYGLGFDFNMSSFAPVIIGIIFIVTGNFMPRFKPNYTVGIKTPWTLANEEVWIRTHRLGSRIFFFGGLAVLLSAFLPSAVSSAVMFALIAACVLIPTAASFIYYKKINNQ